MEHVDAIVTWVDGNDPKHIAKRAKYINSEKDVTSCGKNELRFIDANEIKYCIYSLRKYASWIRHIYLVTDDQCPEWLTKEKKEELGVIIIDHKLIFKEYSWALPTFNIRTINTLLYKIPGLANKFIVLNDDFFLLDNTSKDDFFIKDKTVFRGVWKPNKLSYAKKFKRLIKGLISGQKINKNSFKVTGVHYDASILLDFEKKHFETLHAPHPAKVDVLKQFFETRSELLKKNVQHRFRNKNQTNASCIFTHLMIKEDKAILKDGIDSLTIIPRYGGLKDQRKKFDTLKKGNHNIKFLCFQDLVFLKQENYKEYLEVTDYLNQIILND